MVDTMQPEALVLVTLFPSVSTVIVAMRTYVRMTARNFSWDDGLMLVAWALAVAHAGVTYKWIRLNGFGYHVWDLDPLTTEQSVFSGKLNMAQQLIYNPILCVVKASIILFLLRLGDQRKGIKWFLYGLFLFNFGHLVGTFFGALTQCRPIPMYWNHYYTDITLEDGTVVNPGYSCFDEEKFSLITAGFAILTDVLILCVPIAIVKILHLGKRKKIGVIVVLSLGWIVTVVGVLRFKIFYDYWEGASKDSTYGLSQTVSGIEVNVAIWAACGPAIKAFITKFAPTFFGTSRAGTRATDGSYQLARYSLRGRMSKSQGAPDREAAPSAEQGGDADSQKGIILGDSLRTKSEGFIGVTHEVLQYSDAASDVPRGGSGWNASEGTTDSWAYR